MRFWNTNITKDQSRDTGMAMVLLLLIVYWVQKQPVWVAVAGALHILNMIVPKAFQPVAVVWLGLAHLLGTVMSKVLLTIVFYAVVTPIGILRNLVGKDSLHLRAFKTNGESVMLERNHLFTARDLERPY